MYLVLIIKSLGGPQSEPFSRTSKLRIAVATTLVCFCHTTPPLLDHHHGLTHSAIGSATARPMVGPA